MTQDEKSPSIAHPGESGEAEPSIESTDELESRSPDGAVAEEASVEERAALLADDEADRFRQRWESLQIGFVDRPREMVQQADELVEELMQRLTAGFNEQRSVLEEQWDSDDDASTEDLRVALTRYRSFFHRLLSA
jgi:hypothetical protein